MNTNMRSDNKYARRDLNDQFPIALRYRDLGFSLLPVRADGSKAPVLSAWKDLQTRLPTDAELKTWFGRGTFAGIAIIGGAVSGNLEVLDFDEIGLYERWRELAREFGLEKQIASTPLVQTPSGGYHAYYRCEEAVPTSKPLARRYDRVKEKIATLAETKAEGGYVLAPGSPIECHEDNKPYWLVQGSFDAIPTFTRIERDLLVRLAASFNEYTVEEEVYNGPPRMPSLTRRPGDDFNNRGDIGPILTRAGWTLCRTQGSVQLWRRPGKTGPGISATSNWDNRGRFHNFSTNALPFEADRSYSPFAVKALLDHAGDFSAAAGALADEGYGEILAPSPSNSLSLTGERENPASRNALLPFSTLREKGSGDEGGLIGGEGQCKAKLLGRLIDAGDIADPVESLPTLCGPYVLPGAIHLLFGTRGIGKSTLVLGLAAAIARGEPWQGVQTTQANVLYMDLESGAVLQAVKVARLLPNGIEPGRFYFLSSRLRFPEELPELIETAASLGIGLIVFDTLRRCFAVRDENDNAEFYARVAPIIDTLKQHEIASLLIAHPPKGMAHSARGAGAQEDAVDIVLSLTMHQGALTDANGIVALSVTKHRLLGVGIVSLCLRRIGNDRFAPISSASDAEDAPAPPSKVQQCEAAIVRALDRLDCEPVTYKTLMSLMEEQGFIGGTFKTALRRMKSNGALDLRSDGYYLADIFGPGNTYLDQLYTLESRLYSAD